MDDLFQANVRELRKEIASKRARVQRSHDALKEPTTGFAQAHRSLLAVHDKLLAVLDGYVS